MERDHIVDKLVYPLYGLFHIHTDRPELSARGGYLYDIVPDLMRPGKEELLAEIVEVLELGLADPDIKLTEIIPDLPRSEEEIRFHLTETLKRMKSQSKADE